MYDLRFEPGDIIKRTKALGIEEATFLGYLKCEVGSGCSGHLICPGHIHTDNEDSNACGCGWSERGVCSYKLIHKKIEPEVIDEFNIFSILE